MTQNRLPQRPVVYGYYCPRCNHCYTSSISPAPPACDWCIRDGSDAYDMPLGSTWVTS
jgi:hypothetical protein